jgi:hypothetical protein
MRTGLESRMLLRPGTRQHLPILRAGLDSGIKVSFRDGRAFVPVARSGCGVACKYCYISAPGDTVIPLSRKDMRELLGHLRTYMQHPSGTRPIMAIGCDTEVGLSQQLTRNVLICLDFAIKHGLPVQIATKFPLALPLRERLESWPADSAPPLVFTTITTVAMSERIEPNAPNPLARAINFTAHLPAWRSYALIKPFLSISLEDREFLLSLLSAYRPDGVVVGVRYRRQHASDNYGDPHPVAPDWIATLPSESAKMFARKLTELGLRVFMNTQCASSWHDPELDSTIVRNNYPHLCVQCGRCPKEEKIAR